MPKGDLIQQPPGFYVQSYLRKQFDLLAAASFLFQKSDIWLKKDRIHPNHRSFSIRVKIRVKADLGA